VPGGLRGGPPARASSPSGPSTANAARSTPR
jgi:hypothetical protein